MTPRTLELFEKPPRAKPRVMMKADDHGAFDDGRLAAHFVCGRCEYQDWLACSKTEGRRGLPCPKCNYCDHCSGTGMVEMDNNGPIGPCPVCRKRVGT